jgi:hypothetical protein
VSSQLNQGNAIIADAASKLQHQQDFDTSTILGGTTQSATAFTDTNSSFLQNTMNGSISPAPRATAPVPTAALPRTPHHFPFLANQMKKRAEARQTQSNHSENSSKIQDNDFGLQEWNVITKTDKNKQQTDFEEEHKKEENEHLESIQTDPKKTENNNLIEKDDARRGQSAIFEEMKLTSNKLQLERTQNGELTEKLEKSKKENENLRQELATERENSKRELKTFKKDLAKQVSEYEKLKNELNNDEGSIRNVKLEAAKEIAKVKSDALEREAFYRKDIDSLTMRLSSAQAAATQAREENTEIERRSQREANNMLQREMRDTNKLKVACEEQKKRLVERERILSSREKEMLTSRTELEKISHSVSQLKTTTEQKDERIRIKEKQINEREHLINNIDAEWKKRMTALEVLFIIILFI